MRSQCAWLFVFSLFSNVLLLVSSIYMLQVFDRVLSSGSLDTLAWLTGLAVAATAVYAVLEIVRRSMLSRIGAWIESELAPPVLRQGLELRSAQRQPEAGLGDVRDLKGFLGGDQILAFLDAPWMPIFLAVIWILDPLLGLMAITGAIFLFVMAIANDLVTRRRQARAQAVLREGQVSAQRFLDQSETVVALGMADDLLRNWSARQAAVRTDVQKADDTTSAFLNVSRFVRLSLQVLILGAGAWLVLEGRITSGGMIAASIILSRALSPVERSISAWRALVQAREAHRNLSALFGHEIQALQKVSLPRPAGKLDVTQLRFAPAGSALPILKQITFSLEPGEVCGIVGPSGSGKSTLCRLLVGLWAPNFGNVRLDGADVATWEQADLARHTGYLPQQVEFFPGTIAQNIARMRDFASEDVIQAARLADVHELILSLKDGYETDVGLNGARLSGGQKQRIGLARALFGDPQLIVLDEPNSNLDSQGEQALHDTLQRLKQAGRTILMVAHRPQALRAADKVLLVRDGVSIAFGPRDEVMAKIAADGRVVPMSPVTRAAMPSGGNAAPHRTSGPKG